MPISLDTGADDQSTISLDTQDTSGIPTPTEVAPNRASKVVVGLPQLGTFEGVHSELTAGNESKLRQQAASDIDSKKLQARQQNLVQYGTEPGATVAGLVALANPPKMTNTDAVFEQEYSKKYFKALYGAPEEDSGSWWEEAVRLIPKQVDESIVKGSEYLTKQEILRTKLENANSKLEKQSWPSYLLDMGKAGLPFYTQAQFVMAGASPPVLKSVFSGEFLNAGFFNAAADQKARQIMSLPVDQFNEEVNKIYSRLEEHNPQTAVEFLQYMQGLSTDEFIGKGVFATLDLTSIPGTKLAGKGISALAQKAGLYNKTQKAMQDVAASAVKAAQADSPELVKSAMAEGAGDLKEAAIQKVTDNVIKDITGASSPIEKAIDPLLSVFKSDQQLIKEGPGKVGGQSLANKIVESYEALTVDLLNTIIEMTKVERIPLALASQKTVRAAQEASKDSFKGLRNTILDTSEIQHEPLTNTYFIEHKLGNSEGLLFPHENTARNWALLNGINNPEIGAAEGKVPKPPVGFRTSKGSVYELRPGDTTIRNKAARKDPGHEGDYGIKPQSSRTVYLASRKEARALTPKEGESFRILDHGDGTLSLANPDPNKGWSIKGSVNSSVKLETSAEASKGKNNYRLNLVTSTNSKVPLDIVLKDSGKTIYVRFIGEDKAPVKLKVGELRDTLRELKSRFPEAKYIEGDRVSGARGENGSLARTKLPSLEESVSSKIPYHTEPGLGRLPLELFTEGTTNGSKSYRDLHLGHHIKEILTKKEQIREAEVRMQIKDAKEQIPSVRLAIKAKYKGVEALDYETRLLELNETVERLNKELTVLNKNIAAPVEGQIAQQGKGFYIRVRKALDETQTAIRDGAVPTGIEKDALDSYLNSTLGLIRTPDEVLSMLHNQNRKTAAYGVSPLIKMIQDNSKYLDMLEKGKITEDPITGQKIPFLRNRATTIIEKNFNNKAAQRWVDLKKIISLGRDLRDEQGRLGYFYKNAYDLEAHYLGFIGRLPDAVETAAYFEFKKIVEMDRAMREVALNRNMLRLGTETHTIVQTAKDGSKREFVIDAKTLDKVPGGTRETQYPILWLGTNEGSEKVYTAGMVPGGSVKTSPYQRLVNGVEQGSIKIVDIFDKDLKPFQGYGLAADETIRYVAVPASHIKTEPLKWKQIPRREGGHFDYDHEHYIKQADMHDETVGRNSKTVTSINNVYRGDNIALAMSNRKLGRDYTTRMNAVRELLRDGKEEEAKALATAPHEQGGLAHSWDEFRKSFKAYKDEKGNFHPARFSLNEPFVLVPKNKRIIDMSEEGDALKNRHARFVDGSKSGSLARINQIEYTSARDAHELMTINDVGSRNNPVLKYEPAKLVDPITTLNRSTSRISNSLLMDDMKTYSREHWLAAAAPHLIHSQNELRSAPFYYFEHPVYKSKTLSSREKRVLEIQRMQINQFEGVRGLGENLLHSAAQDLADSVYGIGGPKALKTIDPLWLLPKLTDPSRFIRSVIFNAKLGTFNLAQFVVQLNTFTNIHGIAGPKFAAPGTQAALLHYYSTWSRNPNILNKMDSWAQAHLVPGSYRVKPGEFLEGMRELNKTGFEHVAGEHIMTESPPTVTSNTMQSILYAGQAPFRTGEKMVRLGAWYTAFFEYREKNPVGPISNLQRQEILRRADDLQGNMSRASSSSVHSGLASIPAQFYAYSLRQFELFTGKRLTPIEKARLFTAYSLVYGIPGSLGVFGFPFGDYVRKAALTGDEPEYNNIFDNPLTQPGKSVAYAINQGTPYVAGDNLVKTFFMEGGLATLAAVITGNYYNFGERMGVTGFEPIREALRSDNTVWKILTGAAGSAVYSTWENSEGFRNSFTFEMLKAFRGTTKGDVEHPFTADDLKDMASEVSSFKSSWRLLVAANTGHWVSGKESYLTDTSPLNALFMTLVGVQPTGVSDLQIMQWSTKDVKDLQKHVLDVFIKETHRQIDALNNNDPEQAAKYKARAWAALVIGKFPEEKYSQAIAMAHKGYESMIDRVDKEFYGVTGKGNIPQDLIQKRLEAYPRQVQQRSK